MVWVVLGVTTTIINLIWVTHALCTDVMVRGDAGVVQTQEGVGPTLPSSNMYMQILTPNPYHSLTNHKPGKI